MEITLSANCPDCGSEVELTADIGKEIFTPANRAKIKPVGNIDVYRFTSNDIKQFIIQKVHQYVPDAIVDVYPRYCEKKRSKPTDPHRSYASLRIAMSTDVLEKSSKANDFYEQIAESAGNMRFTNGIFVNIINLYCFGKKDIAQWTKNYKNLEYLEDEMGMTEAYINDIREFSVPRRIQDKKHKDWIIFAAAAEKVIRDMLTDFKTNTLPGKLQIVDVYPISKDIVEFLVYMHPKVMDLQENVHVRQILSGEEKVKD